jgi:SAM-dependent methyltransferase
MSDHQPHEQPHDQHQHQPEHQHDPEQRPGANGHDHASWEQRYRGSAAVWSGRVNPPLVAETAELAPGRALDVGCGEGGDVLWLAARGWQVTGLDWSQVALDRAAGHAAAAGLDGQVTWVQGDVDVWEPPLGAYELVSAHFLHPTADQRGPLLARLAAAVARGGTLLWVGHPHDQQRAALWGADRFVGARDVAADLDPHVWEIVVAEQRPRPPGGDGHHEGDEVLRARRR